MQRFVIVPAPGIRCSFAVMLSLLLLLSGSATPGAFAQTPIPVDETPVVTVEPDIPVDEVDPGTSIPEISEPETPAAPPVEETPEPGPQLAILQTTPVECFDREGNTGALVMNASSMLDCTVSAELAGDSTSVQNGYVSWNLEVGFPDAVELVLPADSPVSLVNQQAGATGSSRVFTVTSPLIPEQIYAELSFTLVLTRTTCNVGEYPMTLQATPSVQTDSVVIATGDAAEAAAIPVNYAANNTQPTVSMDAVNFGSLSWDGESWGTAYATTTVTVRNDSQCGTSQSHSVGIDVTSSEPGMQPLISVVSLMDGNLVGALDNGTNTIAIIPAGFTGVATVTVEFELSPSEDVVPGSYQWGFEPSVSVVP